MKLQSSDGVIFETTKEVMRCSVTWTLMLDTFESEMDNPDEVIPIPNVSGRALKKILEWGEHYKLEYVSKNENAEMETNQTKEGKKKPVEFSAWDIDFFGKDFDMILELVLASNFLEIKKLTRMLCKLIALEIASSETDDLRKKWGIVNDLDPKLEEWIRMENSMLK